MLKRVVRVILSAVLVGSLIGCASVRLDEAEATKIGSIHLEGERTGNYVTPSFNADGVYFHIHSATRYDHFVLVAKDPEGNDVWEFKEKTSKQKNEYITIPYTQFPLDKKIGLYLQVEDGEVTYEGSFTLNEHYKPKEQ